mmetsp:Transcript_23869/g.76607  ORF Transcript_23869/g.76607 Transcript_23869/m.76607 type:complete len:286 (+) Transcript_23869:154-1011(+)
MRIIPIRRSEYVPRQQRKRISDHSYALVSPRASVAHGLASAFWSVSARTPDSSVHAHPSGTTASKSSGSSTATFPSKQTRKERPRPYATPTRLLTAAGVKRRCPRHSAAGRHAHALGGAAPGRRSAYAHLDLLLRLAPRVAAAVAARKVVAAAVCRRRRPVPPPRRGCPRRVWRQLFETKVDVGLASAAALAPHAPRHVHVAVDRQPAQPGGESERLGSFVARPRAQRAHLVDVDADADPAVGGARLSEGVRLACAAGSQLLHRLRRRRAQRLRSAWRAARHHVA